jgi:hypothetical protein
MLSSPATDDQSPLLCPSWCSNVKRQLKAAIQDRDGHSQRSNELTQQLQDKKRQLFSAIQVRAPSVLLLAELPCLSRLSRQLQQPPHLTCSTPDMHLTDG